MTDGPGMTTYTGSVMMRSGHGCAHPWEDVGLSVVVQALGHVGHLDGHTDHLGEAPMVIRGKDTLG